MQAIAQNTFTPPLPKSNRLEKKRLVQAEIDHNLFDVAEQIMKEKKLTIKDVMTWSFQLFVLRADPKEAARLGIKPEKS